MGNTITVTDLRKNVSDILNRVRYRGERFTVRRNGETIAVLEPAGVASHITMRELAEQMGEVPLPDAGFADDLEAMRQTLRLEEPLAWPN